MSGSATPAPRRLSTGVTAAYGFGAVAYGVKDAGFNTFLLIYYNQVLGVNSLAAGFVIMAALVLDAFIDPAVGILSDRTRGRWGRRHPWMYASALPIAIGWILLWNPPVASDAFRLLWLFATAVMVRSAVSCFEVPSQALTPEFTSDYDERTRITAYRYLFGWAGGLLIVLLAYAVFLTPTAGFPNGLMNPAGYRNLALSSAAIMIVAILVSALGTHGEIKRLPQVEAHPPSFGEMLRELWQTLHNRAFVILIGAGICAYTNQGINYALSNYFYNYVWRFDGFALKLLPFVLLTGAALAFVIAPRVGRAMSKPRAACLFVVSGAIFHNLSYALRFAGLMPAPGNQQIMVLFPIYVIATALTVSAFILGASMMADVVEDAESRTGRRNEGVFFAGSFFVQKCTSGLGTAMAGLVLWVAGLGDKTDPASVPVWKVDRLTLTYMLIYLTLAAISAYLFTKFPFGRREHEARLAEMAAAAEREGAPHAP